MLPIFLLLNCQDRTTDRECSILYFTIAMLAASSVKQQFDICPSICFFVTSAAPAKSCMYAIILAVQILIVTHQGEHPAWSVHIQAQHYDDIGTVVLFNSYTGCPYGHMCCTYSAFLYT